GGAVLAAVLPSIVPAISAVRVDPLQALSPLAQSTSSASRPSVALTIVALLLCMVDPAIAFSPFHGPYEREIRLYGHIALGLPTLMLGFFLLAPLFVWL